MLAKAQFVILRGILYDSSLRRNPLDFKDVISVVETKMGTLAAMALGDYLGHRLIRFCLATISG
jgi:hypothetical protein